MGKAVPRGKKHYFKLRIKNTSTSWMLFELRMGKFLEKGGRHGAQFHSPLAAWR